MAIRLIYFLPRLSFCSSEILLSNVEPMLLQHVLVAERRFTFHTEGMQARELKHSARNIDDVEEPTAVYGDDHA